MTGIFWPAAKLLAFEKKDSGRYSLLVSKLKNIARIFIFAQYIYMLRIDAFTNTR